MKNDPLTFLSGVLLLAVVLAALEAACLRRARLQVSSLRVQLGGMRKQAGLWNEMLRRNRNRIHALNQTVRTQQAALLGERDRNLDTLRRFYQWMGRFLQVRSSMELLQQDVASMLGEFGLEPGTEAAFVAFLDEKLGGTVSRLREEVPSLSDADILLFCCLVIGYDTQLSSRLMGIDNVNTYYSRKNRLIYKIRRHAPRRAKQYLDLFA